MSEDETSPIPSLSSEEPTPVSSPQLSRSQQRRQAVQQGRPAPTFGDAKLVLPGGQVVKPGPALPIVYEPVVIPKPYAKWKVLVDMEVPRGASSFFLAAGTVISEQHYDVAYLVARGVKLETAA